MAARAFHSTYGGDPAGGLAFAVEASELAARVHPRTRGWLSAVESEMHARAGDQAAWERAVDAVAGLVAGPMPGPPSGPWRPEPVGPSAAFAFPPSDRLKGSAAGYLAACRPPMSPLASERTSS
jgi:hypothetical protein